MTKTLYVSVSDFGSIAGVNKWRSREDTLLKCWCQNYKEEAKQHFRSNQYVIKQKAPVKTADSVIEVEKEFAEEVRRVRPKTSHDTEQLKIKFTKKLDKACDQDSLSKNQRSCVQEKMKSVLKTSCGINSEEKILNDTEKKTQKKITDRNSQMYYKTIYMDDHYIIKIGGRVDGISEDDMIIEAKNRMKESTVRRNEYDLYQLMGYIYLTDKHRGKLVQKFNDRIWDSDEPTSKEWGIVTLDDRWTEFYENKLLTFFEELKKPISIPRNIVKPFLRIDREDNYFPSVDNNEIERDILRLLYNV